MVFIFPSVGMVWGLCFSSLFLILCKEMMGMSFFISCMNSWAMMDSLSILMELLVVLVMVLSLVCSVKDLFFPSLFSSEGLEGSLVAVSVCCMVFFIMSGWMSFYFFFEFSLIPTLWMILKWGYQPERFQAVVFMVMYTVGGSLPLLVVLLFAFSFVGSDSFLLGKLVGGLDWNFPSWIWGFVLLAFLVKIPIYGFHGWLPKAHVEAPLAGSMVLAGVLLKLGGFGLIRVMWVMSMYSNKVLMMVISFSIWGGFLSCLVSMTQSDVKSIIAYSSVSHMSMVIASILSCYPSGKFGGECMMFTHGICSPCMFALAASAYDWSQSRSVMVNTNVLRIFPIFSIFWFVFGVVNMGCPPSLNYFSEVFMFSVIKELNMLFILPLGLMCQFSCVFTVFLYGYLNHGGVSFYVWSKSILSDRYLSSFLFSGFVVLLGFTGMEYFFV
uniref:NADH-ubiquinone oxidoreductase chain 4 n=1 Tax=Lutraria rhynchaena TaxID=1380851 RepID=W1I9L4_9BIVA|nr:NADH dehydrogenase subunit 4 [Lutraria rhynchaena]CDL72586.1 NADH dehydrogenase subunit 4 [Lutraria rhynchaena]